MGRRQTSLGGLSLIETVVAFTLLSLLICMLAVLIPTAVRTQNRTNRDYQARAIAFSLLEQARSQSFGSFTIDQVTPVATLPATTEGPYRAELRVLSPGSEDPHYLKLLRVTVYWKEREADRSAVAEGYVSKIQR